MDLLDALVQTQALRIAPPGEVFWYTSGTLGPYYINTHYLFGGPAAAEELLAFIDSDSRAETFHQDLLGRVQSRLDTDPAFRGVIEALVAAIRDRPAAAGVDMISGGERRDWFFSLPVAVVMNLPHLYIFKDNSMALAEGGNCSPISKLPMSELNGKRTAHVADLVTEASSYARNWIPAVGDGGGKMAISANVIDRAQGGMDVIAGAGVDGVALLRVDDDLFDELLKRGLIDAGQHEVLRDYFSDPTDAMKRFLQANPTFLQQALASSDERTARRAALLVENDPYGL